MFFIELLQSDSLGFIRRRGLLGYAGGGLGISGFEIQAPPGRTLPWSAEARFATPARALELQLANGSPAIRLLEKHADLILKRSLSFEYSNEEFMANIVHESYTDIMKSPRLSAMIAARTPHKPNDPIDLSRLPQIRADQTRVLIADGTITDPVDLILRVAEVNFELWYASYFGNADMFTETGSDQLLKEKLARHDAAKSTLDGFLKLIDLTQMPDVATAVAHGDLPLSEVVKIRETPSAVEFRRWLRNAEPHDARDLERAFVAALSRPTLADSLPLKTLRFVITAAVGLVLPVAGGIAASAVDSFVVDQWLKGFSPRIFLDELRRLELGRQRKH